MVEIMHDDSTNALNAAILPILNGTAPFTNVEHVEKRHQDTHLGHVEDEATMMIFVDITTLMAMKMEILPENVDLR
jgi:hypothetical protein